MYQHRPNSRIIGHIEDRFHFLKFYDLCYAVGSDYFKQGIVSSVFLSIRIKRPAAFESTIRFGQCLTL